MLIKNGNIFTENHTFMRGDLFLNEEIIDKITPPITPHNTSLSTESIDASGLYVIPGFIDLHLHGCLGHDFSDGTLDSLEKIASYQLKHGVTGFLPTTMSLPHEKLITLCKTAAEYANSPSSKGSQLLGIHLEGPYLSKVKCGAHEKSNLRCPNLEEYYSLQQAANGLIKIISLAPELKGTFSFIEKVRNEVILSIAHSNANYSIAKQALEAGVTHLTHLYNAMPEFNHRAPGIIGAAFKIQGQVELICDGYHVHPAAINAAFKLFGYEHITLISDSTPATGMPNGTYSLGGQTVFLKNKKAKKANGTLAGSSFHLMDCVKYLQSIGYQLENILPCVTENPAKELNLFDQLGSIAPNKKANLLVVDSSLNIHHIIYKGRLLENI